MASSRRTYDTDVITLRTVFAKNPGNSNVPALRTLTADGQGGTFWAIPSTLGVYPAFNQIITSGGTYTADLSYNTFRLTAGENIGMTNGPPGSNQTYLFAKAFSQIDVSGENSVYAFLNNQLDSSVTLAGQGGITLRADPATNTLFFVGPASNSYTVSTGIYGFNQIKVVDAASTITSSIQGWDGNYLTATSPSTLLNLIGYNDIQMSTNVTTNSIYFKISTFTSQGYLDISANAYGAYPSTLSTVSSLYVQQSVFNSTVAYLSSYTGFGFSSVVSSVNALAMSTGEQFYILTGLINARATIIQLNNEISNVNTNIQSTSIGLGTLGYISTGGGGAIGSVQLLSTVEGLGSAGYISSVGGIIGNITTENVVSTVEGLGTVGYVSSLSTITTSSIFNTGAISTYSLEVFGPATFTNSGSTILRGPIYLAGPTYVAGAITGASNTVVTPNNLTSTVAGLGSSRYISSTQLQSTIAGLGSIGYLSSLRGFAISSGNVTASSLNLLDPYTNALNYLTVSSGSLLVNGAKIEGGSGGGGGVAQIVAGTGINITPAGGTGVVTITNTGATTAYVDTAISSFSTALGPLNQGGGGGSYNFSTVSSVYGSNFVTNLLTASTMTTANILPSQSNTWVTVGYGSSATNSIQTSIDGLNWTDATTGGFSTAGKGVAYNGSYWVSVGNNGTATGSIQYSSDGKNWSNAVTGGFSSGGNGVAWNGSYWIAVGNNGGSATTSIQISRDGKNWSGITSGGFSTRGEAVAWNGSYWVAVGLGSTQLAGLQYSVDGLTWVSASTGGFSSGGKGIAWNGSLWVAAGDDTTRPASLQYSGDGRNWSNAVSGGFLSAAWKVAWNGKLWVAVGDESSALKSIQTSVDGSNWTDIQSGGFTGGNDGYGIAWNGFYWIATGIGASATNSIQRSFDGLNWTSAVTGGFASGAVSVGFSSNLTPGYNQQGLTILSQNIPLFLNSTNQIMAQPSSLLINNSLLVDGLYKRVGVNCNTPAYDLDVLGIGHFTSLSSLSLQISTINGIPYGLPGYPSTVSTNYALRFNTSSLVVSSINGIPYGLPGYPSTVSTSYATSFNTSSFSVSSINGANFFTLFPSTVDGLGQNYVSTASLVSSVSGVNINLLSTTYGLQTSGFLSTSALVSTTYGLQTSGFLSTSALVSTTYGLQTSGFLSTSALVSTTYGLQTSGFLSTSALVSTTYGLQTSGFLSTSVITSTVGGLGQLYISSLLNVNTLSSLALNVSSINGSLPGYGNGSSITVSTGLLNASSIGFVNIAPTSSNLWVMPGANSAGVGRLKYSFNGITWTNTVGATFSGTPYSAVWNGNLWLALGVDSTQNIKYSYNGISWANVPGPKIFSDAGVMAAWNGRMWVAVGNNGGAAGGIKYSYDGFTWNDATGFTTSGANVTWNGYMWVAVGNDSTLNARIKYSYDGINWFNSASGAFTSAGYGVAWNGQIWVAVGNNSATRIGSIKYSRDGINWSNNETGGFAGRGWDVHWNGQLWVAAGNDGDVALGSIQTSTDGIRWSSNTGFSKEGHGVTWNGSLWVAGGEDATAANRIKYSYDGITWFNSSGGATFDTANGGWIPGYSSNVVPSFSQPNFDIQPQSIPLFTRSTNQLTFLASSMTINNTLTIDLTDRVGINTATPQTELDVAGTGRFTTLSTLTMNVSSINGAAYTGGGGGTTTQSLLISTGQLIVSSMNQVNIFQSTTNFWVAVGLDSTSPIKYSYDGTTWANATGAFSSQGRGVAWNGFMWVAVGYDSSSAAATIKYSYNGLSWTNCSLGGFDSAGTYNGEGIAWNGRFWVALGAHATANNTIQYSGDGINFSNSTGGFSTRGYAAAWNGRMWVAVGEDATSNNTIKYSYNGTSWSNTSGSGFAGDLIGNCIAWNGRMWIAGGADSTTPGNTKYSYDGVTWYNNNNGNLVAINSIAWNGRMWVCGGTGTSGVQKLNYSYDGLTWSAAVNSFTGSTSEAGRQIAWNGRLWIATGKTTATVNAATLRTSTDGINWTALTGPFNVPGIAGNGYGVAFTSNMVPSYQQENLDIWSQNIPIFTRSTNQIFVQPSSLLINNTLTINAFSSVVGINCNLPTYTLDVNGVINAFTAVKSNGTNLTSDRRIKQFITSADLDICYYNVKNLPLRRFEFIDTFKVTKYDGKQVGFIADEVEQYYPKAVNIFPTSVGGFSTLKHLNYDQLFFANFGATKRLMDIVESQDSTIHGQSLTLQTLSGQFTSILSTLNGLQGR